MNVAKTDEEGQEREAEAVSFLNESLEPLRARLKDASPSYCDMLKDVVALIAFPDPEVCCAVVTSAQASRKRVGRLTCFPSLCVLPLFSLSLLHMGPCRVSAGFYPPQLA